MLVLQYPLTLFRGYSVSLHPTEPWAEPGYIVLGTLSLIQPAYLSFPAAQSGPWLFYSEVGLNLMIELSKRIDFSPAE